MPAHKQSKDFAYCFITPLHILSHSLTACVCVWRKEGGWSRGRKQTYITKASLSFAVSKLVTARQRQKLSMRASAVVWFHIRRLQLVWMTASRADRFLLAACCLLCTWQHLSFFFNAWFNFYFQWVQVAACVRFIIIIFITPRRRRRRRRNPYKEQLDYCREEVAFLFLFC